MAGGVAAPIIEPPPVAPVIAEPITDWSGFYAGLSVGRISGKYHEAGFSYDIDKGTVPAIFGGYNWQSGKLVYGGELSIGKPDDVAIEDDPVDGVQALYELSGRLGYTFGKGLIYGKLGYAKTSYDVGPDSYDFDGASYGIGFDYLYNEHWLFGASATKYDMKNDDFDGKLKPVIVALRVGYKF